MINEVGVGEPPRGSLSMLLSETWALRAWCGVRAANWAWGVAKMLRLIAMNWSRRWRGRASFCLR